MVSFWHNGINDQKLATDTYALAASNGIVKTDVVLLSRSGEGVYATYLAGKDETGAPKHLDPCRLFWLRCPPRTLFRLCVQQLRDGVCEPSKENCDPRCPRDPDCVETHQGIGMCTPYVISILGGMCGGIYGACLHYQLVVEKGVIECTQIGGTCQVNPICDIGAIDCATPNCGCGEGTTCVTTTGCADPTIACVGGNTCHYYFEARK